MIGFGGVVVQGRFGVGSVDRDDRPVGGKAAAGGDGDDGVGVGELLGVQIDAGDGLGGAAVYLFGRFSRPEARHDDALGDRSDQGRTGQCRAVA